MVLRAELKAEITHSYPFVTIDPDQFGQLLDIVRWRTPPRFSVPGRTAWHELYEAATYHNRPQVSYYAAKIKGVGLWNPTGYLHSGVQQGERAAEPIPPTSLEYEPITRLRHVGISKDGEFVDTASYPAPYGGILHERALLEYTNASTLLEHNVPCIAPLAVVRYPELSFRGQFLGAVITLSTERQPYRAHIDYINEHGENAKAYFLRIYRVLGIDGDPRNPFVQWKAYEVLYARIGTLLRAFAEAGLYRYASQLENLHFDVDRNELFLTDLDSSRRLDDLPQDLQVLQITRDIASALHKAAWRLHYFVTLDPWPIDRVRTFDPFVALLRGYFPESSEETIRNAVEPIWRLVIPHLFLRKRLRQSMLGWDRDRLRSYEVDRDVFYCLSIISIFGLFATSSLALRRPSNLTSDMLYEKAKRFLGPERFNYLCWLQG